MTIHQRLTALLLLGTGFMLSVDFSILNVALPDIGRAVGLDVSKFPWIATAYALPAAGFSLLLGRIADLYGRRRLFLGGIALLAAASLLGGFASDARTLIVARVLQGFATAAATPAALSMLVTTFSDDRLRARVLGMNGALLSGGFTVGALVGGSLVEALSWRWAFLINAPVAVLIVCIAPFILAPGDAPARVRLDVPGALAVTLGLLGVTFGITNHNLAVFLAGVALLVVFWFVEKRAQAPLAAVSLLSLPTIKWGNAACLIVFSMESALIFLMTLYLQQILRLSPFATGLVFGIPGLSSVLAGVLAGRFINGVGSLRVLLSAILAQALLTAPLICLGVGRQWLFLLVPALFVGFFAHVTAIVAAMVTATSGVPDSEQGLATGLASMSQQVAITVGIPVLGSIAAIPSDLLDGISLAIAVNVVATLAMAAAIWAGLRAPSAGAPASRVDREGERPKPERSLS